MRTLRSKSTGETTTRVVDPSKQYVPSPVCQHLEWRLYDSGYVGIVSLEVFRVKCRDSREVHPSLSYCRQSGPRNRQVTLETKGETFSIVKILNLFRGSTV